MRVKILSLQNRPIVVAHMAKAGTISGTPKPFRRVLRNRLLQAMLELQGVPHERFRVVSDRIGRPEVQLREGKKLSVSFSSCRNTEWAALATKGGMVGIDCAHPEDFPGTYPFHRVFLPEELTHVEQLGLETCHGAAMLWAAKEAVVKALGCGFHLIAPLDVQITWSSKGIRTVPVAVTFSQRSQERYPNLEHLRVDLIVFAEYGSWLAVALHTGDVAPFP